MARSITSERVEAIEAWVQEVRRFGEHMAEQQRVYAALNDALERLHHAPGVHARTEREAAFPPAARAPASAALAHTIYQPSVSVSKLGKDVRKPAADSEPNALGQGSGTRATSSVEEDAQLAKVLEEARSLRSTQAIDHRYASKSSSAGSRPPRDIRNSDAASAMSRKVRGTQSDKESESSRRPIPPTAPAKHQNSGIDNVHVASSPAKSLGELEAGESDALDRILRQAREIAALNDIAEAPAGHLHSLSARQQGAQLKGTADARTVKGRPPAASSTRTRPSATDGSGSMGAGKLLQQPSAQGRKTRGSSLSREAAASARGQTRQSNSHASTTRCALASSRPTPAQTSKAVVPRTGDAPSCKVDDTEHARPVVRVPEKSACRPDAEGLARAHTETVLNEGLMSREAGESVVDMGAVAVDRGAVAGSRHVRRRSSMQTDDVSFTCEKRGETKALPLSDGGREACKDGGREVRSEELPTRNSVREAQHDNEGSAAGTAHTPHSSTGTETKANAQRPWRTYSVFFVYSI